MKKPKRSSVVMLGCPYCARTLPEIQFERKRKKRWETVNAEPVIACVNALAGLNPEGVRPLVEAARFLAKEAHGSWAVVKEYAGNTNVACLEQRAQEVQAALALLEGRTDAKAKG